jgi:hypothetical protein
MESSFLQQGWLVTEKLKMHMLVGNAEQNTVRWLMQSTENQETGES